MRITMPITCSPTEVWVFVDMGGWVDACRIATTGTKFVGLPTANFNTEGLFPTDRRTGQLINGLRWADTTDITVYADFFNQVAGKD